MYLPGKPVAYNTLSPIMGYFRVGWLIILGHLAFNVVCNLKLPRLFKPRSIDHLTVASRKLEYGSGMIQASFPSSLGFGVGGTVITQLSGFYCASILQLLESTVNFSPEAPSDCH